MGTGFNNFQGIRSSFNHDSSHHYDNSSTVVESFDHGYGSFFDESFINNLDFSSQEHLTEEHNSSVELTDPSLASNLSSSSENANTASPLSSETGFSEDFEGSYDVCLNYINQILMEDDFESKFDICPENPALLAAEQPFYDVLVQKFPPVDQSSSFKSGNNNNNHYQNMYNHGGLNLSRADNTWPYDPIEFRQLQLDPDTFQYTSGLGRNSFTNTTEVLDEIQSQQASQFQKGLGEALKFLPGNEKLVIDFESNGVYMPQELEYQRGKSIETKSVKVRKSPHDEDLDLVEGRRGKQSAVSIDDSPNSELFDKVLLCSNDSELGRGITELQKKMQNEAKKMCNGRKSAGKKCGGAKNSSVDFVDLRTLLIACAQAITTDDQRRAYSLLKQIRQHTSLTGNANQRLAHYFAEGLEARLTGTGSQVYYSLIAKQIPISDFLKSFQLYLAACPFISALHFFANKVILDAVKDARKLHIIDFGTQYGFQWPSLLQKVPSRFVSPPKIRLTAIDTPIPGFRPSELLDQAGNRLTEYACKFDIPFEFRAVARNWDEVRVEDLNIKEDELVIVNCLNQLKKLGDESVSVDSPRNVVLKTIRKMNPGLFIHGNSNGSYSSPFFATRFREALFHFSALFDMMEANVQREEEQRLLIEKMKFGREIINVVACEGSERVERPETYKQLIARNLSAGFVQVPLDAAIARKIKDKMRELYNKDYCSDEDRECLLMGWKGRILHSLSVWKPDHSS